MVTMNQRCVQSKINGKYSGGDISVWFKVPNAQLKKKE